MVYYLKNWYSYACSESLYCFQPWQAVIAIINNNNNQWKHCGFSQARSSGPLVLLQQVNDGLGRVIHFLSCSVTGAPGESAAHVPALHRSEGRRSLESEPEMGGALQRSPHRIHTGAFHFLFELYPCLKSKTGARRWMWKQNGFLFHAEILFRLWTGNLLTLQSRSSFSLYGWTHSRALTGESLLASLDTYSCCLTGLLRPPAELPEHPDTEIDDLSKQRTLPHPFSFRAVSLDPLQAGSATRGSSGLVASFYTLHLLHILVWHLGSKLGDAEPGWSRIWGPLMWCVFLDSGLSSNDGGKIQLLRCLFPPWIQFCTTWH